jgi:hypothetical protein
MTKHLRAARILAALVAAGAIAGTALAVDPSGQPSASPAASSSAIPAAASPSLAETLAPSDKPSPSVAASPPVPSQPSPSSATPKPEVKAPEVKAPEPQDDDEGAPSAEKLADVVLRLKAAGVPATSGQVQDLAGKVGLGGAVRVLAFAHASGKTPAQILALFAGGMGWGEIDHELHLSIGPGIGWIMGHGHGHGHGHGNGHANSQTP